MGIQLESCLLDRIFTTSQIDTSSTQLITSIYIMRFHPILNSHQPCSIPSPDQRPISLPPLIPCASNHLLSLSSTPHLSPIKLELSSQLNEDLFFRLFPDDELGVREIFNENPLLNAPVIDRLSLDLSSFLPGPSLISPPSHESVHFHLVVLLRPIIFCSGSSGASSVFEGVSDGLIVVSSFKTGYSGTLNGDTV